MRVKKPLKNRFKSAIFGVLFAILGVFGALSINTLIAPVNTAYAEPASETTSETTTTEPTTEDSTSETTGDSTSTTDSSNTESVDTCQSQVGALAFIICPGTGVLSQAVDSIYSQIEKLLVVEPISFNTDSPIFQIWQVMRDITNVVFVIMILVVIYSQITGVGISNYGIKKALPKLIIAALLVNLSYIICAAGVDISNIVGSGIQGLFEGIQVTAINNGGLGDASMLSWTDIATALIGGGAIAGVAIGAAGGLTAVLFPFLAAILGAIISVVVGLFTLGLRQALISMLVMISPIAFVCYLLPNTEKWFEKWKEIFFSMLFFYPLFSLLYGASQLAGWALIASSIAAGSLFGIIIGLAVQVIPLILSIALMKMSGTVLGKISSIADNIANKPREGLRGMAARQSELARQRRVNNSTMPTARLQRYMDRRNRKLELEAEKATFIRRGNAEIWAQKRISGLDKYDPANEDKYGKGKKYLRTTKATREAKLAGNIEMAVKTAQDDAKHVINGSYDQFHGRTAVDRKLANQGAHNFIEMNRAAFTLVNDDEADFNFLTNEYFNAAAAGPDSYQYKHFIKSAGGGLGAKGSTSVLGQLIAKTAANESRHRHDFSILANKFNVDKQAFRDMAVGYYRNDDGIATFPPDKNGKRKKAFYVDENGKEVMETYPGEFLYYHPEALHPYKTVDEHGEPYYDMTGTVVNPDGTRSKQFITRIYKHDTPVMKEILQTFDTPIQDPVDGLYGILAGNQEGSFDTASTDTKAIEDLKNVGLFNLRTTVARAIGDAHFNEKAAFAGPMYTAAVARGNVKNFVDQNFQRLDNFKKTVKSGRFNTQDKFELELIADLLDPKNFLGDQKRLKYLWPEKALRNMLDVNDKLLEGITINGKAISPENASYDDLLEAIKQKYYYPAIEAAAFMMSNATSPNVSDSLKSGAAEAWTNLADVISQWDSEEARKAGLPNPFKQKSGNVRQQAFALQGKIKETSEDQVDKKDDSNKSPYSGKLNPASSQSIVEKHTNPLRDQAFRFIRQLDDFRNQHSYDPHVFGQRALELIGEAQNHEFQDVYFALDNYIASNPNADTDTIYKFLVGILREFDY